jgi:diguanylate cyclase (GGDEF)-like protein
MNSSQEALQTRIAVLGEVNSAELNGARLAELLTNWVRESLGLAADVELAGQGHAAPPAGGVEALDRPPASTHELEVTPTHWRFPLVHRGRHLGRLSIAIPEGNPDALAPTVVQELVHEFAKLLDQARRFEEAREEALKDELTGLGNRRMFERSLRGYIDAARTQRFPFSILLFDVDHFKKFNDTWGHDAGDRVLKLVADLMKRVFRTDDVVCRIGGEEFAVLLCDGRSQGGDSTPPREARAFGERLQREAERLSTEGGDLLAKISLSGGVATFPWDAQSPEDLLREADNALYAAKRGGRNRIYFAGDDADIIATLAG